MCKWGCQWDLVAKEEAASLTVGLESVFVTTVIDAEENREVVTIAIPGAFLHVTNEDYVVIGKDEPQAIQEIPKG